MITKTIQVRASRLKDCDFPIEVRFSSGWHQVHYVTDDAIRNEDIVVLWDRDGGEIAKLYPSSDMTVKEVR